MEYSITNFSSGEVKIFNVVRGKLEAKLLSEHMPKELPMVVIDEKYAYELLKKDLKVERYLNL